MEASEKIARDYVNIIVKVVYYTTIRQYDGLYVRIPNQKLFNANITNFVAHAARYSMIR